MGTPLTPTPAGLKSWMDLVQNASEATMHLGVNGEDLNNFLHVTINVTVVMV